MILHALQITSLFLHWFPACVAYTERWHPDVHVREHNKKAGTAAMEEWHNASLWDLVVLPMAPYLLWALLYYLKVGAPYADLKVWAYWGWMQGGWQGAVSMAPILGFVFAVIDLHAMQYGARAENQMWQMLDCSHEANDSSLIHMPAWLA